MSKLVTKNFNVHSAIQFKESFTEPANTLVYLFYGRHKQWEDGDSSAPTTINSLANTHYDSYDHMLGGKQVTDNDVKHMVRRKDWTNGTKYDMYDDSHTNLDTKDFFVVVSEQSQYNVFKCLDNNYGANSVQAPSIIETSANDEIYITESDGYQWKYMYTIPSATWDKFATAEYMPVVANTTVEGAATQGGIHAIKVTDSGRDYAAYANGFVSEFGVGGDPKLIAIASPSSYVYNVGSTSGFVKEEVETKFVESILIIDGGAGFATSDTITVNNGGGATLNATATIASVNATGGITGITITGRGKSYTGTPTVTVSGASNTAAANLIARLGTANGVIVDSNSSTLTVSSINGNIDNNDEIRGVSSNTYANVSSRTMAGDNLSSNTDFYKGSSFYVERGTGAGQLGTIDEYIVTADEKRVLLASDLSVNLDSTSFWSIGPQVQITGDGNGAKARALVDSTLNANVVANVQIVATGNNYTWADILIQGNTGSVQNAVSNSYITTSSKARAIISPQNGHGYDPLKELYANRIGISVTIANTESAALTVENDFREIGLLKDPLFANGTLVLSSSDTNFVAGEKITGATSNATAVVVSANASGIAMKDIRGFFATETITGNVAGNSVVQTVTQPTTVFRQTHKYTTELSYAGTLGNGLIEDELISQGESLANAHVVVTPGAANGTVETTRNRNVFLLSDVSADKYFSGQDSAAQMKITDVVLPDLKDGSGEVIYKESLTPISRNANQSETFKLILEF